MGEDSRVLIAGLVILNVLTAGAYIQKSLELGEYKAEDRQYQEEISDLQQKLEETNSSLQEKEKTLNGFKEGLKHESLTGVFRYYPMIMRYDSMDQEQFGLGVFNMNDYETGPVSYSCTIEIETTEGTESYNLKFNTSNIEPYSRTILTTEKNVPTGLPRLGITRSGCDKVEFK